MKTIDKHALRGLHHLSRLSFAINNLISAPPLTHNCFSLRRFDLRFNKICKIPSSYFANCTKLVFINLRGNCLSAVPHLLHISNTIRNVILYGNYITSADILLENTLPCLVDLDIGKNLLLYWRFPPRSFWPNLQQLDLRNNRLSVMTQPFNYGRISVRLGQHALSCNSHLDWMRRCKVIKGGPYAPMLTCGNHDETRLIGVSFSCPGAQGWMKKVFSLEHESLIISI